ncbi:uncharacterized protein MELLADRAFT_87257 [Melampsora larici-populina 98AG31]|uniref:CxC1-like cysteine cluster associated with KDZ transposases domain-containing protein n=1 Tax=Melampsora larici-populina (strain 98AG31 / pathotype 3-4-7) TaxID=747676 RepID=F4SDS2_MELLP|nr:uncharacterized protein MELLADRAFT_87257 [Melampsora larici-populina 98AG31]EGF97206.1 hypothetical protein MELLADRAFT_87257 [Melampsora larici-populina 98AG31]
MGGRSGRKLGGNITNVKEEKTKKCRKKPDPKAEARAEAKFMKKVLDAKQFLRGPPHHPHELAGDDHDPLDERGDLEQPDINDMLLNELMLMNGDDPDPPDDDGNDPWTDIEDFDRDGAIRRFVQKHRGFRYARKRETLRKQWEALENQITAVYLENKVTTLNWTTETSYLDVIISPDCQCAAGLFHIRKIDLIDILGYLAASPTQPRTAFSIPLLQQHHDLWLTSVTASKDQPDESKYPPLFIKPSKIRQQDAKLVAALASGNVAVTEDPCSESHKTANDTRSSSTWDRCDDTGLFAAACRHDVPLVMANIYQSGEKLYYPLSLMKHIMDDFPFSRFGVLYDIGCHLDKHIRVVCFSYIIG